MTVQHIHAYLDAMVEAKASDLYLTFDSPPSLRVGDVIVPIGTYRLTDPDLAELQQQMTTEQQRRDFEANLELNMAMSWGETARFRVNMMRQQGHLGIVTRRIQVAIPTLEELSLPPLYGDLVMLKRGLVLIVGATGAGKSTSLASMVGYRNRYGSGHIITIEDPIEFLHEHNQCLITQRDVGLDTYSYTNALKNALRQRPDLLVIGEVRDREMMEQAIHFSETGHLCIATLHANNSSQAIERVLNFFPEDQHRRILTSLMINLRAVLSQRLVPNINRGRTLALEIMLNNGLIRQLLLENKLNHIREMLEKGGSEGMHTFDQHLLKLLREGVIDEETALTEADNPANIRLRMMTETGGSRVVSHDIAVKDAQPIKFRNKPKNSGF